MQITALTIEEDRVEVSAERSEVRRAPVSRAECVEPAPARDSYNSRGDIELPPHHHVHRQRPGEVAAARFHEVEIHGE